MSRMSGEKITVDRSLVGILALACLGAAFVLWLVNPESHDGQLWLAGFVRVGIVMCAFWFALPSSDRKAAWVNVSPAAFFGILLAVIATVRLRARVVIPIFIVLAVAGFLLRPREKQRPTTRPNRSP